MALSWLQVPDRTLEAWFIQGFWLGYVQIVVPTITSTHFLMKPVTEDVDE
jgi:hypothetical protein